jgi:NADH-quinone oxidoreductase subunit E
MAACIPALHLCQRANGGWLSPSAIAFVASRLELPAAHVQGVVTFYSLFNQAPPGEHQVWVCRTLSCALRGADTILRHCERKLGVRAGGTTGDRGSRCAPRSVSPPAGRGRSSKWIASIHEDLTLEKLDRILDRLLYED